MIGSRLGRIARKAVFALPFLCPLAASAAPTEEHLAPSMLWRVEWAKDSCLLRRAFGPAEDPVLIQFERFSHGEGFQLLLAGNRFRSWEPPVGFGFEYRPGGGIREFDNYRTGKTADGMPTLLASGALAPVPPKGEPYPSITPEMESAISSIAIVRRGQRIVLDTGSLGPPFAQLRRCTEQLVESWGIDLARWNKRSRGATPINSPGYWLTGEDYPTIAALSGKQATINFRLTIGPDGLVTGCSVQSSYSGKSFDDLTCRLLTQRARFKPALDADGKPMSDFYINRVHWFVP